MTEAEKAYAAAEQLIEEARLDGRETLEFNSEEFRALEVIPPQIAGLTELRTVDLDNTQITDVTPLATLTELRNLFLSGTLVFDATPLAFLSNLTRLHLNGTRISDLRRLAHLTNLMELYLSYTRIDDLIPLAALSALQGLHLQNTQVTDVSPIASLANLTRLDLVNSAAEDLRPLQGIQGLVKNPWFNGLSFKGAGACRIDPRIDEISKIGDDAERARRLFDYMEDWVAPWEREAPQPDPLIPVGVEDGRLEIAASTPSEAEKEERLKQVLHEQLKSRAHALANAAGNRFFRLSARARGLQEQVEKEFAELDLLLLHLAVEDIRALSEMGREEEDGEAFPPEVTLAMEDVLRLGPGLTLGNEDVDLLVERTNARRAAPAVPEEEQAAQDALSKVLIDSLEAVGEQLRGLEETVLASRTHDALEVQKATNRNVVWIVASSIVGLSVDIGGNIAAGVLTEPVMAMIGAHMPVFLDVSSAYGPAFMDWAHQCLGQFEAVKAQLRKRRDS